MAPQPILESSLMNGQLEPTNEPYAISKIAGIKQCESYNRQYGRNYRCIMPTNLYGPNDNFHPMNLCTPGLMRRFHEAVMRQDEEVVVWGSGNPRREFLHVDDLASACIFLMSLDQDKLDNNVKPMQSHINIGTGVDNSISEISRKISEVTGYDGKIRFDNSKPDGTPRKILDVSLINKLGWESSIELDRGLARTYEWFLENFDLLRVEMISKKQNFLEPYIFETVISSVPLVSVDLVIENTQNKFLMGLRKNRPAQGHWFVPEVE